MEFQCFEVKPEDECPQDDKPSTGTGMLAGSDDIFSNGLLAWLTT